jgi:lipopolysaccharide/colanic/teichoic acid biosynthesis glycosyltransferase
LGYGWRIAYNARIFPSLFRNRVLFVGPAHEAGAVVRLLKDGRLGYALAAVVATDGGTKPEDTPAWSDRLADLPGLLERERIQTLVVGHRPDEIPGLADALYPSLFSRISLIDRASLEEAVTGKVPLEHVSQLWFLEHIHEQEKAWIDGAKRVVDVLLAIPFGLATILMLPFVALAIRLSSPGPVFIRQTRIGKLNKPFTLIKFRSMHALSPDGSAETKGAQFTQDAKTDPRLFPVGRILRQTRLDEFPQIWNVLRGDLSFVGPRPERPEFVEPLQAKMPFYALRHLVRPGLTGWAQVRYLTPVARLDDNLVKLRYDLYYIRHRSLLLDFAILLKTVGIMLRRQGT